MARLAPSSPHLLHMPSHTYVNLGRYADASRVNEQALAADEALAAELGRQGFSVSKDWRGHNGHFLWYAALMEGRGDVALATARASASRAKGDHLFAELTRSRPLVTLLRLERWDAVLREPMPTGDKGMASLMGRYAQGVALARTGQVDAAEKLLAQLEPDALAIVKSHPSSKYPDKVPRGVAEVSLARLKAEVALAKGAVDDAITHQAQSLAAGKDIDEFEPPLLAAGSRVVLGGMQLKARRWVEAEQSFRADLVDHPRSGWALRGLMQALDAQGRGKDYAVVTVAQELRSAWPDADPMLLATH
jgi:predicted Zn-dependent protease